MPTIPRIENQIEQRGLPNARVDANAPLEAFGGGAPLARVESALDSFGRAGADFFKNEKKKADDLVVQDKLAAANRKQAEILYDPRNGAYWQKGKNSFGLIETHYKEYNKYLTDLEKDLDDDQRGLFRRHAANLDTETYQSIMKHIGVQIGDYDEESTKNYIEVAKQKAVNSLNVVGEDKRQIDAIANSLRGNAARLGKDPKSIEAELTKAKNDIYAGRVRAWLERGMPEMADQEMTLNGTNIFSPVKEGLEADIKKFSGEKYGRTKGEEIYERAESPTAALAEAQKIQDKSQREAAVERVRELSKNRDDAKEAVESDSQERIYRFIRETGGKQELPSQLMNRMSPEGQSAALSFKNKVLQGEGEKHDAGAWEEFMEVARRGDLKNMPRSEFFKRFYSKFKEKYRDKADTMWQQARNPKKDKQAAYKSTLSTDDMVRNAMIQSGILDKYESPAKMSKEESQRKTAIEEALDAKMESYYHDTGKNAGDDLKKQYLNEIIRERVMIKKGGVLDVFFPDKEVPAAVVTPDERGRAYVPYDSIPSNEVNDLLRLMRSRGLVLPSMSDEAAKAKYRDRIERAYGKAKTVRNIDEVLRSLRGED